MQSFDKTSFDELLGELDKEFQRMDSGELMRDSILSNDGVGRVDDNSFPGFTAEEQRTIMEKFTLYQAQHAHAVANQTPREPSINQVQAASIKQPATQPTLFHIMGNPMHRHPQALASGGFAAFSALPQPRSSSFSQHPISPTFQRLQGQAGGSRPNSGPLPYVGGEDRVSPESARASPSSPSIKRRQPSDDEGMSSGRYSPSTISPANSFRDATKRPSPGPLGTSPPSGYVMPRSSLAQLGAMSESGGDEGDMTDEKRKEKNRLAQRKHRDKQKNQFTTLQSQLDAKDAQLDAKDAQLQTAVALIQDLTTKLQLYQSTFGPLPSPPQTTQPPQPPHT